MSASKVSRNVLWIFATLCILGLFLTTHIKAQDWHISDQVTMSWDAVDLDDGSPAAVNQISYTVYMKKAGGIEVEAASGVTETQHTFTFTQEGSFYLGVKAVRSVDGQTMDSSRIAWSNIDGDASPGPWGVLHYVRPAVVGGLRKQ